VNENTTEIKDKIRQRFVKVALDPTAPQRHPNGPVSAKKLGYAPAKIDALPIVGCVLRLSHFTGTGVHRIGHNCLPVLPI
jgi:hypothetical protein